MIGTLTVLPAPSMPMITIENSSFLTTIRRIVYHYVAREYLVIYSRKPLRRWYMTQKLTCRDFGTLTLGEVNASAQLPSWLPTDYGLLFLILWLRTPFICSYSHSAISALYRWTSFWVLDVAQTDLSQVLEKHSTSVDSLRKQVRMPGQISG